MQNRLIVGGGIKIAPHKAPVSGRWCKVEGSKRASVACLYELELLVGVEGCLGFHSSRLNDTLSNISLYRCEIHKLTDEMCYQHQKAHKQKTQEVSIWQGDGPGGRSLQTEHSCTLAFWSSFLRGPEPRLCPSLSNLYDYEIITSVRIVPAHGHFSTFIHGSALTSCLLTWVIEKCLKPCESLGSSLHPYQSGRGFREQWTKYLSM